MENLSPGEDSFVVDMGAIDEEDGDLTPENNLINGLKVPQDQLKDINAR